MSLIMMESSWSFCGLESRSDEIGAVDGISGHGGVGAGSWIRTGAWTVLGCDSNVDRVRSNGDRR